MGAFEADFTVTNDMLSVPIEEFTIFFPVGEFENISILSTPAGFDPLAIQPDPGIPDDGFIDFLALGTPINPGLSVSGFVAMFTFLGSGSPDSLMFDIIDPNTFDVLQTGTVAFSGVGAPPEVPLPGAVWLMLSGLLGGRLLSLRHSRLGQST